MKTLLQLPQTHRSPLRYPGGKQRAAKAIADLFPSNRPLRIASPFFGGGSVELELASRGHTITGADVFKPVAAFWQQLKKNRHELYAKASEFVPMDKQTFYELQRDLRIELERSAPDPKRLAWLFFVLNRSSFSGSTLSGGMADADRFNKNAVQRLLQVDLSNIKTVQSGDYWDALFDRQRRRFRFDAIYADPPYCLSVSKLYGDQGSTHEQFNHERFAAHMNCCAKRNIQIVVSYNDCSTVRQLFSDWVFRPISWAYGMNSSKKSNEVLITNF